MINSSYTSNLISTLRLPSHTGLSVDFYYNFFTKDEAINEGQIPTTYQISGDDVSKKLPRYNRLNFKKPDLGNILSKIEDKQKILSNIQYIYSCEDVGNTSNTTVVTQDVQLSESLYRLLMRSANVRKITGNMSDISMKLALSINGLSSEDREHLQKLTNSYENSGASFIKDTKTLVSTKFENLETSSSTITVNNKFLYDI